MKVYLSAPGPAWAGLFLGMVQGREVDRIDLKASVAAELIKAMGGGDAHILFHEDRRVSVVAATDGDRSKAQAEAERLLAYLQRRYSIVPG